MRIYKNALWTKKIVDALVLRVSDGYGTSKVSVTDL